MPPTSSSNVSCGRMLTSKEAHSFSYPRKYAKSLKEKNVTRRNHDACKMLKQIISFVNEISSGKADV